MFLLPLTLQHLVITIISLLCLFLWLQSAPIIAITNLFLFSMSLILLSHYQIQERI